jgi:hypothetical protein
MGWFSPDTEDDAIRMIEKINTEMRAINASMHLNYNMIDGRNRSECRSHYNKVLSYAQKYDRIKQNLSIMDRAMFLGASVDVWNGEHVGVIVWEQYFRNVMEFLNKELNY